MTTKFDIHTGLSRDSLPKFFEEQTAEGQTIFVDGDGWEVWGEKIGAYGNDDVTSHVVLRFDDADEAILYAHNLVRRYQEVLTPFSRQSTPGLNGIIVSVTQSDDWAEGLLDIFLHKDRVLVAQYRELQVQLG